MGRTRAERILRAVEGEVWALHPPKLEQIAEILIAKAETGQIPTAAEAEAMEAKQRGAVRSQGAVAVVPLIGTIARRLSALDVMSGGASLDAFVDNVRSAASNPDVGSILLDIHSPGGSVYGVEEAFRAVFAARKQKRVVALVNSLSASAAYYISAGADEIVATPSSEAGSIGVYTVHFDWSERAAEEGLKVTIIKAGANKAEGNPFEALSDDTRAHIQSIVDAHYGQFVRAVAKGRGVSVEAVEERFGQGRTFDSARLVKLGMADRVATYEEVVEELLSGKTPEKRERAAAVAVPGDISGVAASLAIEPTGFPGTERMAVTGFDAMGHEVRSPIGAARIAPSIELTDAVQRALMIALSPAPPADPPASSQTDTAAGGAAQIAPTSPAPAAKEQTVDPKDTAAQNGAATTVVAGGDPLADERKRAQDITQLCHAHGLSEKAGDFIARGLSVDRVGREILQLREQERPGSTLAKADPPVKLTEKENKRYSIARLITAIAEGRQHTAGFEMEVEAELRKKIDYSPKGVLVPTNLAPLSPKAQLTTDTAAGGQELVFIEPGSFIDMLRSRLVAAAMGATFLPGLRGNVDFPKQTGPGTFSWVPESNPTDTPSDSDLDTGTVSLRPKNGRSITSFSRTLLAQAVVNVEQLVRNDLTAIGARGLDAAALHGTGQNNQPTGIYTASGVHPVAFGGAITFPKVVEMETVIAESDGDIDRMGYVSTPGVRGAAKTTLTFPAANTGSPIWTGGVRDGEMNGFRAMASTQVSKTLGAGSNEHGLIFGAWEHLLIGEWGAMDILVDPYTRGGRGLIRVILFMIADVALRYPEAFAKATGLTVATDGS
jgi:HK97 family phage major capsid protein